MHDTDADLVTVLLDLTAVPLAELVAPVGEAARAGGADRSVLAEAVRRAAREAGGTAETLVAFDNLLA